MYSATLPSEKYWEEYISMESEGIDTEKEEVIVLEPEQRILGYRKTTIRKCRDYRKYNKCGNTRALVVSVTA